MQTAGQGVSIEDTGMSAERRFSDIDDRVVQPLFKRYPLELKVHAECGPDLRSNQRQLIEPAWTWVLSGKPILPLPWERREGLRTCFSRSAEPGKTVQPDWLRKPLFSRDGTDIDVVAGLGDRPSSPEPFDSAQAILQAYHPLPEFDGHGPVIGSRAIADESAGAGTRRDDRLITPETLRFVRHAIIP